MKPRLLLLASLSQLTQAQNETDVTRTGIRNSMSSYILKQESNDRWHRIWHFDSCHNVTLDTISISSDHLHVWFLSSGESIIEKITNFYFRINIKSKGSLNSRIFTQNQESNWSPRKINFKKSTRTFRLEKFPTRYMCRPPCWQSVLPRTRLELSTTKCRLLMWRSL